MVSKADAVVERRCRWCGRRFDANAKGRPREFCKDSCRQRDYESRRRAKELGLSEAELIVARSKLDALHDQLYVLEAAIEDVERDVAASDTLQTYKEAVDWLLDAARPVVHMRLTEAED